MTPETEYLLTWVLIAGGAFGLGFGVACRVMAAKTKRLLAGDE